MSASDPNLVILCRESLLGTSDSVEDWLQRQNLCTSVDIVSFTDAVLETGDIETCPVCDTWCEPGELVDDDCNVFDACESCRRR